MKKILIGFIAIGLLTFVGCEKDDDTDIEIIDNQTVNNTQTISNNSSDDSSTDSETGDESTDTSSDDGGTDEYTYKTVKIGEQEWMSMNLNVEYFRNGDIILEANTKDEWIKAGEESKPSWCYYNNNSSNGEKYGKLYNWHAVNDPRGLAPEGWHVPANAEWTVLTDYLAANGHIGEEGKVLKATSGWNSGGNGTDDYGWLGLPGGFCFDNGDFGFIGSNGFWWSSSLGNTSNVWSRNLRDGSDNVAKGNFGNSYGFSVRCLRD
jgi:uncharacterized protein (TIGR02145 family)